MKNKASGDKEQIVVPGLDSNARYVSRLSTRSALYTDFQILLDKHPGKLSSKEYRSLVVEENCLARSTTSARVKLWGELKGRYRLDGNDPLFAAFLEEWCHCQSEQERGLTAYILFALNDRLVADLGILWLFPYLRQAPVEVRVDSVQGFIKQAIASHPEIQGWSDLTRRRLVQHYMASIRDFGLMCGKVRKVSIRPALYAAPMRLLVRALRLAGVTHPLELMKAPIFRLLVLETFEVIDALGELNRLGEVHFRMQGDVVELELEAVA